MKKIKLNLKKLSLGKEEIVHLSEGEMGSVEGGFPTFEGNCTAGCTDSSNCSTLWNCTQASCSDDCMYTIVNGPPVPCN